MLLLEHSAIGAKRLCSTNNKLFVSIKSNWECLLLGPGMKANKKIHLKTLTLKNPFPPPPKKKKKKNFFIFKKINFF